MDESMSGSPSLDLPEANQIATLKIPGAVFELPEGGVGGSSVEDIIHWGRDWSGV
jgi:hypothetical protein